MRPGYHKLISSIEASTPRTAEQVTLRILDLLREDEDERDKGKILVELADAMVGKVPLVALKCLKIAMDEAPLDLAILSRVAKAFDVMGKKARAEIVRIEISKLSGRKDQSEERRKTSIAVLTTVVREAIGSNQFDERFKSIFQKKTSVPKPPIKVPSREFKLADIAIYSSTPNVKGES